MLQFLLFILSNVIETPSDSIFYTPGGDISHMDLKNALMTLEGITMRTTSEKGAIVNFKDKNPYPEWSFSTTFNFPILYPPQTTSVYVWYTENGVEEGSYKGISSAFKGMGVGLEVYGRAVEIVITKNDGSKVEDETDHFVMRDSVSYERFVGLTEITLKVVSTKKNFRVEIYSKGELVYDRLRFEDASALGDIGAGKVFSISTEYQRVPLEKKITLFGVSLSKRTEEEGYEPLQAKIKSIEKQPRMFYDIKHSDAGIRHLISALETSLTYIKTIVGTPSGISIIKAMNDLRGEVENQYTIIKEIKEELKKLPLSEQSNAFDDVGYRIANAKIKVENLDKSMGDFIQSISDMEKRNSRKNRIVSYTIMISSLIVLVFLVFNHVGKKDKEINIPN